LRINCGCRQEKDYVITGKIEKNAVYKMEEPFFQSSYP
jgi:hypothetical protein